MANNRKPAPEEEERKGWYYHFDTFFGGYGWIIGLFMAIAVISAISDPPKAGRSIGAFFGGIAGGFRDAMDGKTASENK